MEGLSGLKTIESVVDCVNSFLTEHHEGTSVACQDISEGVKAVKSLCQENKAVCSKVQTSVASNSSLLSDLNQVQTKKSSVFLPDSRDFKQILRIRTFTVLV